MKSLKYGLVALALAITGAIAPVTNVFAEELTATSSDSSSSWIQVTPVSSRLVLRPGQSLDYSMTVANIGTDKFGYSVYTAPYSVVDEDYNVSFSNETNRTQLSRWIKFINEDGSTTDTFKSTLEPGAKQTVNYRISVPEDVPAGGQYATIFAQTDSDDKKDASGITLSSMVVRTVRPMRTQKSQIMQFPASSIKVQSLPHPRLKIKVIQTSRLNTSLSSNLSSATRFMKKSRLTIFSQTQSVA